MLGLLGLLGTVDYNEYFLISLPFAFSQTSLAKPLSQTSHSLFQVVADVHERLDPNRHGRVGRSQLDVPDWHAHWWVGCFRVVFVGEGGKRVEHGEQCEQGGVAGESNGGQSEPVV